MPAQPDRSEQTCTRLVEKLESVRRSCADAPEDERRQLFRQALHEELGRLGVEETPALLAAVRDRLIRDARQREDTVGRLESEVARLRAENAALREGAGGAPPAGGGDASLGRFRGGLIKLTENQQITADALGLPESEARLFQLFQELLKFAMAYEMGINLMLAEFRVGPAADMDTQMMKGFKQVVRDRFRACLDDKEGSLAELQAILQRNSRFVVDLNRAYTATIYEGTRAMVGEMQPQPILDKHKRMMGFDFEKAWNELARIQSDLAGMTPSSVWERFFFAAFTEKLTEYLEP